MGRKEQVSLAKKIVNDLCEQGATVKELKNICDIAKSIAEQSPIDLECVNSFEDWFD